MLLLGLVFITLAWIPAATSVDRCGSSGSGRMQGLWGDVLAGDTDCAGPDGQPYPRALVDSLVQRLAPTRRGKSLFKVEDPFEVQRTLLSSYAFAHQSAAHGRVLHRSSRAAEKMNTDKEQKKGDSEAKDTEKSSSSDESGAKVTTSSVNTTETTTTTAAAAAVSGGSVSAQSQCSSTPSRLCKTRYNTTAPMYGVSLTSGNPVTIVQKFPDLLQQVIFEVCESDACDVVHGKCVQTYTPHLFLVIPLGPVTLTGQDYVLVESGCVCQPKYGDQTTQITLPDFKP